jgi:membrane associated rhomboid family serine protease
VTANLTAMSRFQFSVPNRRGPDDGWFRVGTFDVGTTVLVVALGVLSMFVYAARKTLLGRLWLVPDRALLPYGTLEGGVRQGQIWRLVTWPLANEPSLSAVIILAVFWWFGRDLERVMGRVRFTWFLLALTLVPATIATAFALLFTGFNGAASGLRFVELGVFVAFIARNPMARFFFGIPGWVIAAVFVGIDLLQFVGNRMWFSVLLEITSIGTALLGLRAMGHAEEATWIPLIPLPVRAGGGGGRVHRVKRRRGEGGGTVVSGPWSGAVPDFVDQEEIDRLLDKVAATGLASLTKDERARLEAASRRKR